MKANKLTVRFRELSGKYGTEIAAHALAKKIPDDFLDKVPQEVAHELCRALPNNHPMKFDFYELWVDKSNEPSELIWLYKTIDHIKMSAYVANQLVLNTSKTTDIPEKFKKLLDHLLDKITVAIYGDLTSEKIRELYDFFINRSDGKEHIEHLLKLVRKD